MSGILSVQKSIDIIEAVAAASPANIGTRELARQLKINVTSAHNFATTLAERGFLRKTTGPRGWKLGFHLMSIATSENFETTLRDIAAPIIEELAITLNETTMFASVINNRMTKLIYITPKNQPLRVVEPEDMQLYAHCTACGKILLASLDEASLKKYLKNYRLEKFTNKTITNTARLAGEIKQIQKNCYAETHDELCEGTSALGFCINDSCGKILAAIGVSLPSLRFTSQTRKNVLKLLKATSEKIEKLCTNI